MTLKKGFMDNDKGSEAYEKAYKELLAKKELEKAEKDRKEKEKK